jgi:Subtilase family
MKQTGKASRRKESIMAQVPVLVEMKVQRGTSGTFAHQAAMGVKAGGFTVDTSYQPVPVSAPNELRAALDSSGHDVVVMRGTVEETQIQELESHPDVVKVWRDSKIAPFNGVRPRPADGAGPMAPCPVPPCDCTFGNPANGTMASVATYLGVDQIWASGNRGDGIVIGIVDGGICAIGRTPKPGQVARVPSVVDGSLPDWGTTASAWGDHGNMTSTDALGMAPNAHIYDIRISDPAPGSADPTVSNALAGFQWAINRHAVDGTPHILSNSWGIFQQSWDPGYASDPNHPFTRKVVEAIGDGILVLFAAGNCGGTCPDGRCGTDTGGAHDIWGANGHPQVMTVGAVNLSEQLVGYSSVGPAALDPNKPDFCSITHFAGYFPTVEPGEPSDTGTSAATPIAAGVVALLKQHKPSLTQDQAKNALKSTAKDIGPPGFDQFTGAGIIRAKAAWDSLIVRTLKVLDDPTFKAADDVTVKLHDDVTVKLQDDPTLKAADDVTVKLHDDPTLKAADDVTVKVADDVTLKAADDVTVKLHDDPTLKAADDVTLKAADDVTVKLHDDPTVKAADDVTVKVADDTTVKVIDDGGSLKIADDGIPGGNPPGGDPPLSRGAGGEVPFILSTPHHSMAWAAGGSAQQAPQAGAPSQAQQYEAALAALEQQIRSGLQQLNQLDAQYRTMLAEYKALGGQR